METRRFHSSEEIGPINVQALEERRLEWKAWIPGDHNCLNHDCPENGAPQLKEASDVDA